VCVFVCVCRGSARDVDLLALINSYHPVPLWQCEQQ
jgi:hypothetical protein